MCNVVGGGDDNKYLMHRVPLLELQRRPVIVSVVARLSPLCFVGGGICWGAQGAVSCASSAYMTWVRPIPQAARCGDSIPSALAVPTLRWVTLINNANTHANGMEYSGLRTWYGASSPNDRTMFSTSFLETFARKNEAYATTIAVESLPPSPDEFIPYFAGELATLFAGTHPIYDFPEGI